MIPAAPSRPHTLAAIAAIEAANDSVAGTVLVGQGGPPPGSGWQGEPKISAFRPYVSVYPSPGRVDGSLAEPAEYLDYRAQATCVSATSAGAESVADLVKLAWVNVPLVISGRASYPGQITLEQQVTRDDSVAPPVHFAIIQVTWRTQAA